VMFATKFPLQNIVADISSDVHYVVFTVQCYLSEIEFLELLDCTMFTNMCCCNVIQILQLNTTIGIG